MHDFILFLCDFMVFLLKCAYHITFGSVDVSVRHIVAFCSKIKERLLTDRPTGWATLCIQRISVSSFNEMSHTVGEKLTNIKMSYKNIK